MDYTTPASIEARSMELIAAELARRGLVLDAQNAPVIRRVIHATADFDFAETLRFTHGAVKRLTAALLSQGADLVTDTNMARVGLSGPSLAALHAQAHCLMADPETAELARREQTTRAAASVRLAVERFPKAIFVVGNAPTALLELAAHIRNGYLPAGVIGVPVGFVNVVESKEELWSLCEAHDIPGIFAMGRKGGSSVAVAASNALLYLASHTTDPMQRGWH